MYEKQKLVNTTPEELIHGIYLMKRDEYRLVQISCTRVELGFELNYTFDKNLEFINYRLILPIEEEIISISRIFSPAFLYENELKDLFGVKINSITIDYDGGLYRVAKKTPMKEFVPPHPPLPTIKANPKKPVELKQEENIVQNDSFEQGHESVRQQNNASGLNMSTAQPNHNDEIVISASQEKENK